MYPIQRLVFLVLTLGMFPIGNSLVAQRNTVKLIKEDGTIMEGEAKFYTKSLSYRPSKEVPYKRFKILDFQTIHIHSEDKATKIYKRIEVEDGKKPKMMVLLVDGPVILYLEESTINTSGYGAGIGFNGNAGQGFAGPSYSVQRYYLKRKSEDGVVPIRIAGKKDFKRAIGKYFEDCPQLMKQVESEQYSKKQLKEIVEYYNNNCIK